MSFQSSTYWVVAIPIAMCGIGLFLFAFYGTRLYFAQRERSEETTERRISNLSGWAGGSMFIGGGMVMLLPARFAWLAMFLAVVLLLAYFPVAAAVERWAQSRSHSQ